MATPLGYSLRLTPHTCMWLKHIGNHFLMLTHTFRCQECPIFLSYITLFVTSFLLISVGQLSNTLAPHALHGLEECMKTATKNCSLIESIEVFIPGPADIARNNAQVISEIRHHFEGKDLVVVAKGPSAKYVKHAVGINQAVILTDMTFMFMNDFSSVLGIERVVPELKYVFVPDYPHTSDLEHMMIPNLSKDYRFVCRRLAKLGFTGKFFVYQIQTSFNSQNEETLRSESSTDVPIQLLSRYFNVSSIHTYGYKRGQGYHPFMDLVKAEIGRTKYDEETAPLANRILEVFESVGINYLEADAGGRKYF